MVKKKQIGWVIAGKIKGWRYPNVKVYSSSAVALRYSGGAEVLPVYVNIPEDADDD